MNMIHELTKEIETLRKRLERLEAARAMLTENPTTKKTAPARRKRTLTAEGRRRISEAVKRRWAKQKKAA